MDRDVLRRETVDNTYRGRVRFRGRLDRVRGSEREPLPVQVQRERREDLVEAAGAAAFQREVELRDPYPGRLSAAVCRFEERKVARKNGWVPASQISPPPRAAVGRDGKLPGWIAF